MASDDDVARAIGSELARAVGRGVDVRVLVDSLHGLHGSYGAENPLLSRLSSVGAEVRVSHALSELPSVVDLKQRDHRKVAIADGRVALVGGRNVGHEYYTGFDEVRVARATTWRELPWLDGGARIEGPAVAEIARSFLASWTDAGGARFEIEEPAPAGPSAVRVIDHLGLRDAATLDVYLELIEGARSHVYIVNGFPLALEVQHALVRAVRRGIRVRVLCGHVTPLHDGTPFAGPWSSARGIATEFVHSRLDPIVEAGGEVHLFALERRAGWAPEIGVVYPHVHAKLMSTDGVACAIGSANLDVTSAYWESELMLVVSDADVVGGVEARLSALASGSRRIDREDPAWRERARRRSWMRRWPGVLAL